MPWITTFRADPDNVKARWRLEYLQWAQAWCREHLKSPMTIYDGTTTREAVQTMLERVEDELVDFACLTYVEEPHATLNP